MNKQGADLKNKGGYTLIEVVLFLALTSAVSLIAFVGLGPRLRNVRFTSGMRSISDTVTKQSSNLMTGFNSGSGYKCVVNGSGSNATPSIDRDTAGTSGSSEGCVINGRAFYFDTNRLVTYYITSLAKPREGCITETSTDLQRLLCYSPRAYNTAFAAYPRPPEPVVTNYPNGITFTKSSDDASSVPSKSFGYLVDPETNVQYQFVYHSRTKPGVGANRSNPGDYGGANALEQTDLNLSERKTYCFSLNSRYAGLKITPDSTTPVLSFEEASCQ